MTRVTLTFDNGPDPEVTPAVLDVLRRHEVRATFFVLGDKLRDRRRYAERAHAEGHWIGNHTFNHLVPLGDSAEPGVSVSEIARTQALIGDLAHPRRLFRPFGGGGRLDAHLLNREAADHLVAQRYTCVLWNVVPQDWIYPDGWVERALALCRREAEAVVVLHDIATGAMAHLDRFIAGLRDAGIVLRQDFPEACIAVEDGQARPALDRYLSDPDSGSNERGSRTD